MSLKFKDVFSLVTIFPSDNVSLIERLVNMSEDKATADLTSWEDSAKEEFKSFLEKLKSTQLEDLPIKCEDGKKQRLSVYLAFNNQVKKLFTC
jgi:hypothetical protein